MVESVDIVEQFPDRFIDVEIWVILLK